MRGGAGSVPVRLAISVCALALAAATVGVAANASSTARDPLAREARTVYLVENAQLSLAREEGAALDERGRATGTYNAPVTATLTIHPTYVTALVTVFPRGGSIAGRASASYIVRNSTGYYGGTFTITRGTGAFRHVSGNALGISGTVNRYTFQMTVKAHGQVKL